MHDLLHPRGSALRRRDDEHIGGVRLIGHLVLKAFLCFKILHAFEHFGYGGGKRIFFLFVHVLLPLDLRRIVCFFSN
jgi:hypothetical protein